MPSTSATSHRTPPTTPSRTVPVTAGEWAPPLWLTALAAVVVVVLVAYRVRRTRPAEDRDLGWTTMIEVVLLSVAADGALAYRILTSALPAGADPDAAALAVSGLHGHSPIAGAVSHSTSWRAAPGRGLVLTYTALPDPDPTGAAPLTEASIVCSTDALRPAPAGLHAHHIAAHGARHLAYLARTDPMVRRAAAKAPQMWALLADTAQVPVAPHDQAHDLAQRFTSQVASED